MLASILAELPTVEHVVRLDYLSPGGDGGGREAAGASRGAAVVPAEHSWSELLAMGAGAQLSFEQVPFEHPLWVLYSSGTTGLPKAIVQSHGGILLEQLKKRLHLDLRRGRPHVLVHDDRLDDVELPRRLPATARRRSCSTTAAPRTPTWACCGSSPSAPA